MIPPNIASDTTPRRITADDRMYSNNSNAKNNTTDLAVNDPIGTLPIVISGKNGMTTAKHAMSASNGVS